MIVPFFSLRVVRDEGDAYPRTGPRVVSRWARLGGRQPRPAKTTTAVGAPPGLLSSPNPPPPLLLLLPLFLCLPSSSRSAVSMARGHWSAAACGLGSRCVVRLVPSAHGPSLPRHGCLTRLAVVGPVRYR
jgi:hypothetical protein